MSISKIGKRNLILTVIVVVVIAVVLFLPDRKSGIKAVALPAVKEKTDRIAFKRKTNEFAVVFSDGDWRIEGRGYPIEKSKIDKIVLFIEKERNAEVVSGVNVYAPYGLDEDSRLQIDFFSGKQLIKKIMVGKSANRFGTFYGMEDDNSTVYQVAFDRYNLDYQEKDILNLKIFDFSPTKVIQASIEDRGQTEVTLYRLDRTNKNSTNQPVNSEKDWKDKNDKVYSKENVNDIVNTLATLQGDSLTNTLNPIIEKELSNPLRKIKLLLEGGGTQEITIIGKDDKGYWVSVPNQKFYYLVSKYHTDKLLSKLSK